MLKTQGFSARQLDLFRHYQQRSYALLESVAAELKPGMTEKDAARQLRKAFHEDGVHTYFHVPVVMFGERTAYPGDFGQLEALATDRKLAAGEPVILDAAPVYEGYTVDTSYACIAKPNKTFEDLDGRLKELRGLILELTRERRSMQQISWAVDDQIKFWGLENCHRKHIAAVLGHRVTSSSPNLLGNTRIWGLAPQPVSYFLLTTSLAGLGLRRSTPNWNHTKACDCLPLPGLWAMEPHIAENGIGVKFEEIMVVTRKDAYWLDDDLPHCRRWKSS